MGADGWHGGGGLSIKANRPLAHNIGANTPTVPRVPAGASEREILSKSSRRHNGESRFATGVLNRIPPQLNRPRATSEARVLEGQSDVMEFLVGLDSADGLFAVDDEQSILSWNL